MSFYDMLVDRAMENDNLHTVCEIKCDGKLLKHYEPATFWRVGNSLWSKSYSLGAYERTDLTPERFNKHIENMIKEGFIVTFQTLEKA